MIHPAALALGMLLAAGGAEPIQTPAAPTPPTDAQIAEQADRLFTGYVETRLFSGAVLIARGDRVLYQNATGLANAEYQVPNTVDTRFGIASITQLFTAAAILRLEEQGKLKLDEPLGTYMPGWPGPYKALTTHQLLIGRSGVKDVTRIPAFVETVAVPRTTPELAAVILKEPLGPPPTGPTRFNNSEYHLLAAIVERVGGLAFTEYVQREIIDRAGLTRTVHDDPAAILDRRASGFTETPTGLRHADWFHMSNAAGMANLSSTVGDVHRFVRALVGGTVISPASFARMTTAHVAPPSLAGNMRGPGIAYGLMLLGGNWTSGGGIGGFFSHLSYDPQREVLFVMLGNSSGGMGMFGLLNGMNAMLGGRRFHVPVKRTAVTAAPTDLAALEGTWQGEAPRNSPVSRNPQALTLRIRIDGGRVFVQPVPGAEQEWYVEAPGRIFARHTDAQIAITDAAAGEASYVVFGTTRVIRRQPR